MKFGDNVFVEMIEIFRKGLEELRDISQDLRDIDVVVDDKTGKLVLSKMYLASKGRVIPQDE